MNRSRALAVSVILLVILVSCTKPLLVPLSPQNASRDRNRSDRGGEQVIYGDDNRSELFAEPNPAVRLIAESTVALMSENQIGPDRGGVRALTGSPYGESFALCKDERFYEQQSAAFCSGFLIAPDLIATAGHCIPDLKACLETSYAFGFALSTTSAQPSSLPSSEVYSCKALLHTQSPSKGADYAIIQLDRPVANHAPLKLNLANAVAVATDVTVLGYPEGLPLKISGGAQVRDISNPAFFVANLDTFGGNSGSAVINANTHEVEGILVRGEKDFVWNQTDGCARSNRCKADECRGEDVTRISEVMKGY